MKMPSWLLPRTNKTVSLDPGKEAEKRELKAELAQVVMTFGRRRTRVQDIAEAAVTSMREGHR
jgi:hypothetical protein